MAVCDGLSRRTLLAAGLVLAPGAAALAQATPEAGPRPEKRLAFQVFRNNQEIGAHTVSFQGAPEDFTATTEAHFIVKFGPIPVFHYVHTSTETWKGGAFTGLESRTVTNGRHEQVKVERSASGLVIHASNGHTLNASAAALPLSHWNERGLRSPLFNPQTGALLRETATRQTGQTLQLPDGRILPATRYTLAGETEIVDWFDDGGIWTALHSRLKDGSIIDYRALA
jgi:hypothetical protein